MNADDVHIGVALVFAEFLQLWVWLIDICVQLEKRKHHSSLDQKEK